MASINILEDENLLTAQARRWVFTINNPFGDAYEDIDISKTTLKVKDDYYKSSVLEELASTKCFVFKYVKAIIYKDEFTTEEIVIKRPFFKDWESIEKYFEQIEHMKYCVYQLEKGEEGTEHLQGAIFYSIGKRFRTIKDTLPLAHIEKAKGSNSQVRDYCTKKDTRIHEPVEIGTFAEERERTDIKDFVALAQSGVSRTELAKLYPSLYLRERNKIDMINADMYEHYGYTLRDVDVTFIYGHSGVGKSTLVRRKIGLKDSFWINNYDNSMFTNYRFQDTIVLDEFTDKLSIQHMNRMLDVGPYEMRGLNKAIYGAFHHVYIISNYSLKELYKDVQQSSPRIFQTFNRRIHRVLRIDLDGELHVERDTEWEDCTNEIDREQGLTKQIKKVWEIDKYGNKFVLYDRYGGVPEFQEIKGLDIPFKEESVQVSL